MPTDLDRLYFVGSIPLRDSEDVFRQLSGELGRYLRRLPDGETGERTKWIVFQQKMLSEHPAMEVDTSVPPLQVRQSDGTVFREIKRLRLKPDADPDRMVFETGYDRAALASYATFKRLKDEGVIAPDALFQVALPTPLATGLMYISPNGRERYLQAYERSLIGALNAILDGIPHQDLSIQFDVCQEVLLFEGYFPEQIPNYKEMVFQEFRRLAAAVPQDVDLGFHLCYGSPNDQPLVNLKDGAVLVDLMNGINDYVQGRVDFIHVPVPRTADDAFFTPFKAWRNTKGTHLYLGLLQHDDEKGDQDRIAAARRVVKNFGVAAECGFGRTDPARVPTILASHHRGAEMLS